MVKGLGLGRSREMRLLPRLRPLLPLEGTCSSGKVSSKMTFLLSSSSLLLLSARRGQVGSSSLLLLRARHGQVSDARGPLEAGRGGMRILGHSSLSVGRGRRPAVPAGLAHLRPVPAQGNMWRIIASAQRCISARSSNRGRPEAVGGSGQESGSTVRLRKRQHGYAICYMLESVTCGEVRGW